VVPAPGRTIYLAGETGHGADDSIPDGLVEQFDAACGNVVRALAGAEARPEHLVSLQIFTTDLEGYLAQSKEIGRAYRTHFGRHYAATALVEVKGLVGAAKVELMGIAVVPDP
jgi:enamine deaminase RidA (YjgF/YER057c/UK114 family)